MNQVHRLIINDHNIRILDEDEMLEEVRDEICEMRELLESILDIDMKILKKSTINNSDFNILNDDVKF